MVSLPWQMSRSWMKSEAGTNSLIPDSRAWRRNSQSPVCYRWCRGSVCRFLRNYSVKKPGEQSKFTCRKEKKFPSSRFFAHSDNRNPPVELGHPRQPWPWTSSCSPGSSPCSKFSRTFRWPWHRPRGPWRGWRPSLKAWPWRPPEPLSEGQRGWRDLAWWEEGRSSDPGHLDILGLTLELCFETRYSGLGERMYHIVADTGTVNSHYNFGCLRSFWCLLAETFNCRYGQNQCSAIWTLTTSLEVHWLNWRALQCQCNGKSSGEQSRSMTPSSSSSWLVFLDWLGSWLRTLWHLIVTRVVTFMHERGV